MEQGKEYYAFISYKREDEKWAKWLQDKLEHYKFPTNLKGRTDLPKNIRPTFRDVTDLSPEPLEQAINNALCNSEWLIVVCSPRSAKSPWVCKEAQTFIDLGRADHIIPFVIEGNPFSDDPSIECYPEALLNLTGSKELLAANINEMGRDAAAIKVVARMFNLRFDTLWQRHEREQKQKRWMWIGAVTVIAIISVSIAGYIWNQNNLLKEKDLKMMENHARMVAEKAHEDIGNGNIFAAILALLEVVPDNNEKPYVAEVESALRVAYNSMKSGDWTHRCVDRFATSVYESEDGQYLIIGKKGDYTAIDVNSLQEATYDKVSTWLTQQEDREKEKLQIQDIWQKSSQYKRNTEIVNFNTKKNMALIKCINFIDDLGVEHYTFSIWNYETDQITYTIDNGGQNFDENNRPNYGGVWVSSFSNNGDYLILSFINGGGLLIDNNQHSHTQIDCGNNYCDHYSNSFIFADNDRIIHFSRFESSVKIIDPQSLSIVDSIPTETHDEIANVILNNDGKTCFVRFVEDGLYMFHKEPVSKHEIYSMDNLVRFNLNTYNDTLIDGRYQLECRDDGIVFKDLNSEKSSWSYSEGYAATVCGFIQNNRYVVIANNKRFDNLYAIIGLFTGIEQFRWEGFGDLYYEPNEECLVIKELDDTLVFNFPSFDNLVRMCREKVTGLSLSPEERKRYYLE